MDDVVHVISVPGNWYAAAQVVNDHDLGKFVRQFSIVGNYTMILLVMPEELLRELQRRKVIY